MNRIDGSELDGRLLHLLLAVLDTGSITAASHRLGVTQSAVSHGLARLRAITGDALFVKSGRGIVATARAQALAQPARELLSSLQRFAQHGAFDPARWEGELTLAANDFQRDLLLPPLAARLRSLAPGLSLRIVPSQVPRLDMLRHDECQLVISPRPPEGGDILQQRLFEDRWQVFWDPAVRNAPAGLADYLAAGHVTVAYEQGRRLDLDERLEAQGLRRRFAVKVPGMGALAAFVRGTPLLATAPGLLAGTSMAGLAHDDPPVACPPMPMYALWHARHRDDPAHRWLRGQLLAVAGSLATGPAQNSSVSTSALPCSG